MLKKFARAYLQGSEKYSDIRGSVMFTQRSGGVLVAARVHRLPPEEGFLGFHIHSGDSCTGNEEDYFADALGHYNPYAKLHPFHAGDMPPLTVSGTNAFLSFVTDRFTVEEIIGKTVIIHSRPDDFTTQPSGNAGEKIACGVIKPL